MMMWRKASKKNIPGIVFLSLILATVILATVAAGQHPSDTDAQDSARESAGQIKVPSRPTSSLFKGSQGTQKTEIHFDPATRTVILKLLVQDSNGYFIPNIRRENFVVYENGVRQKNTSVEIEHAPASIGVLLEFGGRSPAMNRDLAEQGTNAGQWLREEPGHDDRLSVWKYNDAVQKLTDFSSDKDALRGLLLGLGTPEISETNFYDALIFTLEQIRPVTGRKAILMITSGFDTFSKARYEDALKAARGSDAPIYALGVGKMLRQAAELHSRTGPLAQVDWTKGEKTLEEISRVSGGRAYLPENSLDLSPVYDDLLEHLKVRYVITYTSSSDADPNMPRTVRVELIDPKTGSPLRIVDSNGKVVRAKVVVQDSYAPSTVSSSR